MPHQKERGRTSINTKREDLVDPNPVDWIWCLQPWEHVSCSHTLTKNDASRFVEGYSCHPETASKGQVLLKGCNNDEMILTLIFKRKNVGWNLQASCYVAVFVWNCWYLPSCQWGRRWFVRDLGWTNCNCHVIVCVMWDPQVHYFLVSATKII